MPSRTGLLEVEFAKIMRMRKRGMMIGGGGEWGGEGIEIWGSWGNWGRNLYEEIEQ